MRRFLIPGIALAVAVALLVVLAIGINDQGENTSLDSQLAHGIRPPAPSYNVPLMVLGSSRRMSLRELGGKVLVVNLFASWCPPCVGEAPILEREQTILARHDATIVGVTYEDNSTDSETFVRQNHITYPVLRDAAGNFARSYGAAGIPETFVIDRRGRVVAIQRAPVTTAWLNRVLAPILGRRSA
jgi:cytochrome c biogenesis protein CcmG/thiol:disulfide interchange protein DsbE